MLQTNQLFLNDLAQSVANLRNQTQKNHFFSEIFRLAETVKGNSDAVEGVSAENLLDSHYGWRHKTED
jgi:hypothetical protein